MYLQKYLDHTKTTQSCCLHNSFHSAMTMLLKLKDIFIKGVEYEGYQDKWIIEETFKKKITIRDFCRD